MYDVLKKVWTDLTGPGGAFEVEEINVRGFPMRTYKAAPPSLREVWLSSLAFSERPYFNLYGGQYTFMVNFELLSQWAVAEGFSSVEKEYQHSYVGRHLQDRVISLVELIQTHRDAPNMSSWDRDILMLETLNTLNKVYKSHYQSRMEYTSIGGTPSNQQQQIKELVDQLNIDGVPDTVAYVTEKEVSQVSSDLALLGYHDQRYIPLFQGPTEPISFLFLMIDKFLV